MGRFEKGFGGFVAQISLINGSVLEGKDAFLLCVVPLGSMRAKSLCFCVSRWRCRPEGRYNGRWMEPLRIGAYVQCWPYFLSPPQVAKFKM